MKILNSEQQTYSKDDAQFSSKLLDFLNSNELKIEKVSSNS